MAKKDTVARKPKDTKGTLIKMLSYMAQMKWIILLVLVLCVVSNLLGLLGPKLAVVLSMRLRQELVW